MKAILGVVITVWVVIAGVSYISDGKAREYAETATTTDQVVQKQDGFNPLAAFFFGYMLGGIGESPSYREYRTTNNTYYQEHSPTPPPSDVGNWGSNDESGDTMEGKGSGVEIWDSRDYGSWGDDDTGSWGSDSWDSDDSGSWGSDYSSDSDWGSYDSGGDWGSDWGGSSDSGSWGE